MTRNEVLNKLANAKTVDEREQLAQYLINLDRELDSQRNIALEARFHGDFESKKADEQDEIINPAHYKVVPPGNYPDGLEYMDLMTYILAHHDGVTSHLLGQVFKYSTRLGKKDNKLQDAKKIQWYANYLVKVLENEA
jgi:hypothetical protein